MNALSDHKLDPPVRINNERMIRTIRDAIALLREHEMRPGVDDRDEVLHQLERAKSPEELEKAIQRFRAWAREWGTVPVTTKPGSTTSVA